MAETGENNGGPEVKPPTPEEIRTQEVGTVARKIVSEKAQASKLIPEADRTDSDKALLLFDRIQTEDEPDFDVAGNDLKLPGFAAGGYDFSDNDTSVAGLHKVTKDGLLKVSVRDKDGIIVDAKGDPVLFEFPREEILNAQAHSERDAIRDNFAGDELTLFNAYADSLPQNDHPAPPGTGSEIIIAAVAEKQGMLRVTDMQTFIDNLPTDEKDNPFVKAVMDSMQDKVLADSKDFADLIHTTGNDADSIADKITASSTEVADAQAKIDALADPDGADAAEKATIEAEIANAKAKKNSFETAAKILEDTKEPEPPPPDTEAAARLVEVNDTIDQLKDELDKKVKALESQDTSRLDAKAKAAHDKELTQAKSLHAKYHVARMMDGDGGISIKSNILTQIANDKDTGPLTKMLIEKSLKSIEPQVAKSADAMNEFIKDSGLSQDKVDELTKVVTENPASALAMLSDPEFSKIEGLDTILFGSPLDAASAERLEQGIESTLTPEQKEMWKYAKKAGKWGLMALLAAIIAAGAGAVYAGAIGVGGLGAAMKGQH